MASLFNLSLVNAPDGRSGLYVHESPIVKSVISLSSPI